MIVQPGYPGARHPGGRGRRPVPASLCRAVAVWVAVHTALAVIVLLSAIVFLGPSAVLASYKHPDKIEFLTLLENGAFIVLDQRLKDYQVGYEIGAVPEKYVMRAFYTFRNSDLALEKHLNRWVKEMPGSYAPLVARGMYYEALGWASQSIRLASQSQMGIKTPGAYFAAAMRDHANALRINPRLIPAYGGLIDIGTALGRTDLEESALKKGLEVSPASFKIRAAYMLGLQPKWGGSQGKMQAFFQATKRDHPDAPVTAYLEGLFHLLEAENFTGADGRKAAYYDKAIETGEFGQFFQERGRYHYARKNYQRALADFNRSLELHPQSASTLTQRARTLNKLGRLNESLADFNMAVRLDSLDPSLLRHRADLLRVLKRPDDALADLDNALIFGWDDRKVWNTRLEIHADDQQNVRAALDDAWQLFKLDPWRSESWTTLTIMLWGAFTGSLFR